VNKVTLEWLGGFIEAEGSFSRCGSFASKYKPSISISQKHREVLLLIQSSWKGRIDIQSWNKGSGFILQWRHKQAERLGILLLPFLRTVQKRAQIVRWRKWFSTDFVLPRVQSITWEWFTGFVEGDGCFVCNEWSHKYHSPRLQVGQKDIRVLKQLKKFCPISTIGGPDKNGVYSWTTRTHKECKAVANRMAPYLVDPRRKEQFQKWLHCIKSVTKGSAVAV